MPIETAIWRIEVDESTNGQQEALTKLPSAKFDNELRLERLLAKQLDVLGLELMTIGRQVPTMGGKRADILAVDADGELFVVELKRDRTPREAVAQLLDYGSWASRLTYDDVLSIWESNNGDLPFEKAFSERFGGDTPPPDALNAAHHLVLVASELDAASERIIGYCLNFGVPINAVFFRYFQDASNEYLARSWLIDPAQAETRVKEPVKERWTGDYYSSFGEGDRRNWDDARRLGFVSGGGGEWYSRTLNLLTPGARVLVYIPKTGFVGVGEVTGTRTKAVDFLVEVEGQQIPLPEVPGLKAPRTAADAGNDAMAEYVVPVRWLVAVPRDQAFWESGLFGNQNTVCKLRNKFTRDRVLEHFGLSG
jgi:hypothetical protein